MYKDAGGTYWIEEAEKYRRIQWLNSSETLLARCYTVF